MGDFKGDMGVGCFFNCSRHIEVSNVEMLNWPALE